MPEMMKYRKTGKFKLGFLTLLLSVLFVACERCIRDRYRGDDGIKLHIENLDIHAQHIADGIRHIHVDAHNRCV